MEKYVSIVLFLIYEEYYDGKVCFHHFVPHNKNLLSTFNDSLLSVTICCIVIESIMK